MSQASNAKAPTASHQQHQSNGHLAEELADISSVNPILSTERELYSVIARTMAEGVCLVRLSDGAIVYANPKFEQMFGYEPGELNGMPVSRLNYETDQTSAQQVYDRIAQQVAKQGEATYEVQNVRKDGSVFWCEATATVFDHLLYDETVMVAVQQDITERKQAVVALQESERRFRAIFNQTFQLMALLEPDGTVVEVNQTALDFGGLTAEAVMHRPFWETPWWTIAPETQAQLRAAIARAAQGIFVRYEVDICGAEGITASIDFSLKPIHDSNGQINLLIAEGRDITLRRNAEAKIHQLNAELERRIERRTAQLENSRQQYTILTEVSPVGFFRTDETGACVFVNDRWCEICGLTREQILRDGSIQALHPDDYQRVRREWKQAIDHSIPLESEFRFCRPDGTLVWVYFQALPDHTEDVCGFVGTITDITDRKNYEQALQARAAELSQLNMLLTSTATMLEERNRELDQFAYVASHDLKAPLRAIANLAEWIEEDLDNLPPENRRQLNLLRERVRRMDELINGLLQFSRVGRIQSSVETIAVGELLTEVVDSIAPPPSFTIAIAPDMPTLTTHSLSLRQVFANLISNAIKHHHRPAGCISISVVDSGTHYEFAVIDDGPGIAPEHHDRIFVIFQTLHSRDTKESTGVGLSIVKKIVETEGGKIKVESQPGQGATFRFTWLKRPKHVTPAGNR